MSAVVKNLIERTGFSKYDLLSIASDAPKRYKVFHIPKRSGGQREIAQPARELKIIQRALADYLLSTLPIHSAATAYRRNISIRDNAQAHTGLAPILKLDFKDFFPSIVSDDWKRYCNINKLLDDEDVILTTNYLFRRRKGERTLRLSIGAPSSPILSNLLLYKFDEFVSEAVYKKGIIFTRYADDLTFSGQRIGMLRDIVPLVIGAIKHVEYPTLKLNLKKTTYITKSFRRSVTGLVIDNNDGKIGIGRDRKRVISASVHHASLNRLDLKEMQLLCGHLAFIHSVEPQFIKRLASKYGQETINRIQKSVIRPKPIAGVGL